MFSLLPLLHACAHTPPARTEPPPVVEAAPPPAPSEHRDPDADIQVSGELGTIDDSDAEGPFQKRWNDITACYQRAQSELWYVGGRIELKLRIAHEGAVKRAWVSSSTMGNYDVERCMLEIAQTLRFAQPKGGKEAEISFPVEFRSRSALAIWDEARVAPAVRRHRRDVAACKTRGTGGLPRSLTMTMYVAPGGKVTSAGLSADAPLDEHLAGCLVEKARAWRFEDPLGKIAKATVGVRE